MQRLRKRTRVTSTGARRYTLLPTGSSETEVA